MLPVVEWIGRAKGGPMLGGVPSKRGERKKNSNDTGILLMNCTIFTGDSYRLPSRSVVVTSRLGGTWAVVGKNFGDVTHHVVEGGGILVVGLLVLASGTTGVILVATGALGVALEWFDPVVPHQRKGPAPEVVLSLLRAGWEVVAAFALWASVAPSIHYWPWAVKCSWNASRYLMSSLSHHQSQLEKLPFFLEWGGWDWGCSCQGWTCFHQGRSIDCLGRWPKGPWGCELGFQSAERRVQLLDSSCSWLVMVP